MRRRRFMTIWPVLAVLVLTLPLSVTAQAQTEFTNGLLWRVEAANGARNHIFGTIHLTDPRVVKLPEPVLAAFEGARSLTIEMIMKPGTQREMTSMMVLGDGRALEDIIGHELFMKLADYASEIGVPAKNLQMFKPWASGLMIALPRNELMRRATGAKPLDFALLASARLRGLPQFGLETVKEQLGIFDGLPEADQISMLRFSIDDFPLLDAKMEQLIVLYLMRDLKGLGALWTEEKSRLGRQLAALVERRLVVDRNLTMVNRMEARLVDGGAFVAVGALHLPGRTGILALLARRGFRVTKVY